MTNMKRMAGLALTLLLAWTAAVAAGEADSGLARIGVQVKDTPAPTALPTPESASAPEADVPCEQNALLAPITQEEIEAAALGQRILVRGMEGEDVALMQRRLYQLGYYLGKIDGVFGLGTRTAVYGFQRAHKLEKIDGKIGPESIARMFSEDVVIRPTPTPSPTPTPTPSPTPTATPKPTPAPSATPDALSAPFALQETAVYINGQKVQMTLGSDETGELLYPLCGVMAWMDYAYTHEAGSWQLVHMYSGAEIALMTDGRSGLSENAMGACDGVLFLADDQSRVYVYGEEAYVTDDLLGQMGVSVFLVEGVPVIDR